MDSPEPGPSDPPTVEADDGTYLVNLHLKVTQDLKIKVRWTGMIKLGPVRKRTGGTLYFDAGAALASWLVETFINWG